MLAAAVRVIVILGVSGIAFLIGVFLIGRRIDGPNASIVVVDRRTYRLARKRVEQAMAEGNWLRAYAGIQAQKAWLRGEIHTGPAGGGARHASNLERLELFAVQENLTPPTR